MIWLLGCAAPAADEPAVLPSAWTYDGLVDDVPLDAVTVQAVVDELIDGVLAFPARELFPGYAAAVEARSENCVHWAEATEGAFTYVNWSGKREQCDDPESGVFYGQVHHAEGEDFPGGMLEKGPSNLPEVSDAASGCRFTGAQVSGQALVQTPDGVDFAFAGRFADFSGACEDRLIGVSNVSGAWSDDGELAVDWLGPTRSNDWFVRADDVDGWQSLQVAGGIDLLPQTGGTVWTSALYVDSDCPMEPVGEILVRGADGRWATAVFGDDCDGCGVVRDETICVDSSAWVGWEGAW